MIKRYYPLLCVFLYAIIAAWAIALLNPVYGWMSWMMAFTGLFFLFLSLLKFFDLKGFAEGFSKYDFLAKKSRFYAFLYPFLEGFIAFCFLSHFILVEVAFFTFALMLFSLLGVIHGVRENKDLTCACMGSTLNVPLSVVSIFENVLMGVMSLWIAIYLL